MNTLTTVIISALFLGCDEQPPPEDPEPIEALFSCGSEWDDGIDGTIDWVWEIRRDADNRPVLELGDEDLDGDIDETARYEYDASGNETVYEITDGAGELLHLDERIFNADGKVVMHHNVTTTGDGSRFTRDTTNHYNPDGSLDRAETDRDGDGVPETVSDHIYSGGVLAEIRIDSDSDRVHDEARLRTYADGLLVRVDIDRGIDGTIDDTIDREHDDRGNVTRIDDSEINYLRAFQYDSKDRFVEQTFDITRDGSIDIRLSRVFDDEDRERSMTVDSDTGGIVRLMTNLFICD